MRVLQFRLFMYHTLKTLKCITSILQLSLHSLLMKTCACLVLSLLTYLFKCGWASKSNFVYFMLTSSHLIFQLWVAYAPCSAQHKDAVQVTLEQIDLIKRLVETYPNQLELVKTSQGKKILQKNPPLTKFAWRYLFRVSDISLEKVFMNLWQFSSFYKCTQTHQFIISRYTVTYIFTPPQDSLQKDVGWKKGLITCLETVNVNENVFQIFYPFKDKSVVVLEVTL